MDRPLLYRADAGTLSATLLTRILVSPVAAALRERNIGKGLLIRHVIRIYAISNQGSLRGNELIRARCACGDHSRGSLPKAHQIDCSAASRASHGTCRAIRNVV